MSSQSPPAELAEPRLRATAQVVAAALCFVGFTTVRGGQILDASALEATVPGMDLDLQLNLFGVLRLAPILLLGGTALLLGAMDLTRGRWRPVLAALVCCLASVLAVSLLRRGLPRIDLGIGSYPYNTWPSGHVAAACALALACLRLLPPRLHGGWGPVWTAVGLVSLVAHASVASFAHRPSDTIGAVLLTGAVFALVPRAGSSGRSGRTVVWGLAAAAAWAGLTGLAVVLGAWHSRPALVLVWLLGVFGAACWVLLPERRDPRAGRPRR